MLLLDTHTDVDGTLIRSTGKDANRLHKRGTYGCLCERESGRKVGGMSGSRSNTVNTVFPACAVRVRFPAVAFKGGMCSRKADKHRADRLLAVAAFAHAWSQVFDLTADLDDIPHHGMTDGLILVKMLEHRGYSKAEARAQLTQQDNLDRHCGIHTWERLQSSHMLMHLSMHTQMCTAAVHGNDVDARA